MYSRHSGALANSVSSRMHFENVLQLPNVSRSKSRPYLGTNLQDVSVKPKIL